ncbi:acyltransferase family protein [Aliivibrio fischeri]|uniref:acyltransferase family protein n=1 Tax=Aliivibrio fischeri TaxID=668 RepID=UPI0012D98717|nr:acyltransferase family protein [Aliivibrio fischeri]MUH96596.1 acyltransferase family protein [Aliivibrio fischeri]MUI63054.1 acyltransferase family protein [Aliivibrio fischeri]
MNFRYDINGLRGIAIVAVVLFHFNPVWIPGGFAGVDVFFVISGFLMTKIIFKGLENNDFNLFKFYVARANRIIPALGVLCLVLLVLGWFFLIPVDYIALTKHIASSMGFLSNVIYWRESGYFDVASHEKWLLHTWSLSVEWQFYILYPIMLVALKRFVSLENLKRLIVVGTILGFLFSIVGTMKWLNAAYYLLPTRSWEMMLGGIAFLYPWSISEEKKKVAEVVGLFLILSSYTFISSDVPWPGYSALFPVLGAYLMIVANQQSSVITNNLVFQSLGKWSYSVYLWHWPIVVYGYYFDIENWHLYGLLLSIIFGFLSFKYIESLKFKSFKQWSEVLKIKPISMILIIGGGALILFYNPQFYFLSKYKDSPNVDFFINGMKQSYADTKAYTWRNFDSIGNVKVFNKGVLIIGDSQAGDFTNILVNLGIQEKYSLSSSIVSAKCGIGYLDNADVGLWRKLSTDIKLIPNLESSCIEFWRKVKLNIENNPSVDVIFYVMNWRKYSFDLLSKSIESIKEMNPKIKVVIVGKKGLGDLLKEDVSVDLESKAFSNLEKSMSIKERTRRLSLVGDDFIDLYSHLCDLEKRKCTISYGGVPILYDGVHSTINGVEFLSYKIKSDISRILNLK